MKVRARAPSKGHLTMLGRAIWLMEGGTLRCRRIKGSQNPIHSGVYGAASAFFPRVRHDSCITEPKRSARLLGKSRRSPEKL